MGEQVATHSEPLPVDARTARLVIGLLIVGAFAVVLNETTLGVAIPHLMNDLQISATQAQWLTTGFMLTMSVVIPMTGFMLNRLTTRQAFTLAMGVFLLGTLIGALSPGFELLLVARVVQACGTAILIPLTMTTTLNLVPIERRGAVMGIVGMVISVAPALGPTLSGVILQYLSWRWIFIVMIPVGIIPLVAGLRLLVNVTEPRPDQLDWISLPLAAFGFGGLVYSLTLFGGGGSAARGLPVLLVALVVLALFVWRQIALQKPGNPLLDLRTLRYRDFSVGVAVQIVTVMALFGILFLWPLYLQEVHGLASITTGLLVLPGGLALGLLGPPVGRLFDRFGARRIVIPATAIMALAVGLMSLVTPTTPVVLLLALNIALMGMLACVMTPTFTAALNAIPPALYSHGSALATTMQQVAGAAGVALLVSVMATEQSRLTAAGNAEPLLGGLQLAFKMAAGLVALGVVLALFLRPGKPAVAAHADAAAVEALDAS